MASTSDFVFGGRSSRGRPSLCHWRCVLVFAILFLASIISSSDVYNTTTSTATVGNSSLASTDILPANASTHSGAVSTTVTTSIGAEVVEEFGCEDTEFRLTCRELDSTIAILDARFYPSELAFSIDPGLSVKTDFLPPNDTALPEGEDGVLPCPAPKEWVEAGQWARVVGPDEAPVVDPAFENYTLPWPIQPGPGEYHFRLALNHRCSGVNHCSFILASDFEEARHLWGAGAVRIRYACMRHGQHVVRYCNKHIIAGASYSNKAGTQWKGMDRRRKGEGEREEAKKGDEWYADEEEEVNEGWTEGEGFIASPGYPKYYIGGKPAGGVGERKACEWVIRPRYPGQRVQVTLLDVSLRGVAHFEEGCSDWVEVTAVQEKKTAVEQGGEERILLTGCGEAPEAVKIESPEEAPGLRIALLSNSGSLFPKRGILFHYKALGCRWPPPSPPKDGYLVSRNTTVAQYMCCVGYRFPDSGSRERELYCDEQRSLWRVRVPHQNPFPLKFLLPDCIDAETVFWAGNGTKKAITYLNENSTFSEKNAMLKEADFMLDVLVPAIIIGILLLGNGVILYIIFHFKKRKLANEIPEEELRISQNGLNSTTGRPSDV